MKLSNLGLRIQAVVAAFGFLFLFPVNANANKKGNNSTTQQKSPNRDKENKSNGQIHPVAID